MSDPVLSLQKKVLDMEIDYNALREEFMKDERRKGLTSQGLESVKKRIPKLFHYLDEIGLSVYQLGVREAQDYQRWIIEGGKDDGGKYANGTIRNYLKAATRFYTFLKESGKIRSNPFLGIKRIRYVKPLPKNVLKENQINALLGCLSRFDLQKGLYNQLRYYKVHVIAELQYSTGMRISEISALKEEDIDFDRRMITVVCGKGGYSRMVFLNEYAAEVLRCYVEQMRSSIFRNYVRTNEGLFGAGGGRLSIVVGWVLKEAASKVDCPPISSHGFRHAFGFHFLRGGCDLRYIQSFLGHKRLCTTEIYTKVEKEDLRDVLDTYHPRKWRGEK